MTEIFDFKKKYRDLYLPKNQPCLVEIPEMTFAAVEGKGDPNDATGEYSEAVALLYGIQYTVKMSKKGNRTPAGYFDYVVPPLEGLWWFANNATVLPGNDKSQYCWLSMIRLPEFVDEQVFERACAEIAKKKKIDTGKAKYFKLNEGLCVQCLHIGAFDDEPATIKLIDDFIDKHQLENDINETRRHHEIYLSNPNKTEPAKLKTVLRIPVKKR